MTEQQTLPNPPREPRVGFIWVHHPTTGQWWEHRATVLDDGSVAISSEGVRFPITQAPLTTAAAAIVDVWMGGDRSWRVRINDSDFLESADWQMAVKLATAVLGVTKGASARDVSGVTK